MRIWRLQYPIDDRSFATADLREDWTLRELLCKTCGRYGPGSQPPVLEWDPGSDRVGDFTWASITIAIVTERVCADLQSRFTGFRCLPAEMYQDPKLKRPKRPTKRTKPRVWLPYEGPKLFELRPIVWVHEDPTRTTAEVTHRCEQCGRESRQLLGIEVHTHQAEVVSPFPNYELRWLEIREPRQPGMGLYIRAADLGDADFFGVHEFPGWPFCTDAAKEFIEEQGYSNVAFLEMGEAI